MKKAHPRSLAEAREIVAVLNRKADFDGEKRLDADATNMLALSLEYMRAKVYDVDYPALKAREILSVETDVPAGAESFAYEEDDFRGNFRVLSGNGYAEDAPTQETQASKVVNSIIELGGSVIYTRADMRRAAMTGRDLTGRKLRALRMDAERALDTIAAFGNAAAGIASGIVNRPIGTAANQTRETVATAANWDATPDALGMLADANQAVADFVSDSVETRTPDTLVLPIQQYIRFSQTYTADANSEPAMARFLRSNGFVKRVIPWNLLNSVTGTGGNHSRGLLLESSPDVCSLVIPEEFNILPAEPQNWAFKVLASFRTAGTVVYRPLGLRYLTGLPDA